MPPRELAPGLLSWASELDPATRAQAETLARLWVLAGPVALMPDAHLGKGATVGAVIATDDAIVPAAVGVDIGCGMTAVQTDLDAARLPDTLDSLLGRLEAAVPAGLGKWHRDPTPAGTAWLAAHPLPDRAGQELAGWPERAAAQLGTLGSGNHFLEVCLDEDQRVWVMLHSGSRGIGNRMADVHIRAARRLAGAYRIPLDDLDLAYFTTRMPEFKAYLDDLHWAQAYAAANRDLMMNAALQELFGYVGGGAEVDRVDCHHNYTQRERHHGRDLWITRKGAIRARLGDRGIIPGSMGTVSYIVEGRGNPSSYTSCAHGAGRRMSRTAARRNLDPAAFTEQMAGRSWQAGHAAVLLDEAPAAYKDIDQVMVDQADLVDPVHQLVGVLVYKGAEDHTPRRRPPP